MAMPPIQINFIMEMRRL